MIHNVIYSLPPVIVDTHEGPRTYQFQDVGTHMSLPGIRQTLPQQGQNDYLIAVVLYHPHQQQRYYPHRFVVTSPEGIPKSLTQSGPIYSTGLESEISNLRAAFDRVLSKVEDSLKLIYNERSQQPTYVHYGRLLNSTLSRLILETPKTRFCQPELELTSQTV